MPDYARMNQMLYTGMAGELRRAVGEALERGVPADQILERGLISGMALVGEDFKNQMIYVPEVLIASRAMKAGLAELRPHLRGHGAHRLGRMVIGTVEGDLHDIGKNLVAIMAEGAGFEVIDLGVDVAPARFAEAAREQRADLVSASALLTTTMPNIGKVAEALRVEGLQGVRMVCGGAAVTKDFADEIGADGYAPDAARAVETFKSLTGQLTGR